MSHLDIEGVSNGQRTHTHNIFNNWDGSEIHIRNGAPE